MIKEVVEVVKRMTPPGAGDDPAAILTWRWFMALTVGFMFFGYGAALLSAFGAIPQIDGFARLSEVSRIQSDVRESRTEYLEYTALSLRIRQCDAIDQDKSALVFTIQIAELDKKYYRLTGQHLQLPSCQELR